MPRISHRGGEIDQQTLLKTLCDQLHEEGFVDAAFLDSVIEREAIVSTLLGDGIALPHALGLLAKKTVVYTVLAPQGIARVTKRRTLFLLAISKVSMKRRWPSTIFSSLSCANAP